MQEVTGPCDLELERLDSGFLWILWLSSLLPLGKTYCLVDPNMKLIEVEQLDMKEEPTHLGQ